MEHKTYEIYYDEPGDFLEIFFGEPAKCYTEESEPDIFIRKDQETDEVKSIGILSFKKRGAKILKRKVMGLCGSNATKSLDELAAIFYNLGACDSVEDAKDMIPKLYDKNISYTKIIKETGLSSTTVARISKWLNGKNGGYKLMLKKLAVHHSNPSYGKGLR